MGDKNKALNVQVVLRMESVDTQEELSSVPGPQQEYSHRQLCHNVSGWFLSSSLVLMNYPVIDLSGVKNNT